MCGVFTTVVRILKTKKEGGGLVFVLETFPMYFELICALYAIIINYGLKPSINAF